MLTIDPEIRAMLDRARDRQRASPKHAIRHVVVSQAEKSQPPEIDEQRVIRTPEEVQGAN